MSLRRYREPALRLWAYDLTSDVTPLPLCDEPWYECHRCHRRFAVQIVALPPVEAALTMVH